VKFGGRRCRRKNILNDEESPLESREGDEEYIPKKHFVSNFLKNQGQGMQGNSGQWKYRQSSIHINGGEAGIGDNCTSKPIQGFVVTKGTSGNSH
jgi:hypothetical protein